MGHARLASNRLMGRVHLKAQISMVSPSDNLTLGIETSCDETAAAVVRGGEVILSNVVATQDDLHAVFGGVVPEVASRRHTEVITRIIAKALQQAHTEADQIGLLAATQGPGLIGSLLVGVSAAKACAVSWGVPLVGVNHLEAHVMANFIAPAQQPPPTELRFPALCLLASGGHTSLVLMRGFGHYELLGQTRDDAAGEALDKAARLLALGYPGGPAIEQAAASGDPEALDLPRPQIEDSYDFSFAGLKTALARYVQKQSALTNQQIADLAASFQQAVVDTLVRDVATAANRYEVAQILIAGGVAANTVLREQLTHLGQRRRLPVACPPPELCTDNAAMIAATGHFQIQRQGPSDLEMDVFSSLPLAP